MNLFGNALLKWTALAVFILLGCITGPDIELVLQDPREFDQPLDQCDSKLCTSLVKLIDQAEETIDFAVYGTRMQSELLQAVLRARERGVALRGYVDKDAQNENYYSSTHVWEREIGNMRDDFVREKKCRDEFTQVPPCERKRPSGFSGPLQCLAYDLGQERILVTGHAAKKEFAAASIMHNKFFVIDNEHVWTGSANLSNSGTGGYNANAVVILHSRRVASVYTQEFEQLWERDGTCSKSADGIEEFQLTSGKVTTWFSPQDHSLRYGVRGLIAKAETRIHVAAFFLTAKYLTADLIAAHQRGVDVRVIIDATSAKNEYSKHEILREAGIPVKIENWGGKMHMKAASIDDQYLVLGSMNWTSAGEWANDENTLLINSPELTRQFDTYYEDIWQSIPEKWMRKGARPDPESYESGSACTDGVDNDFDDLADIRDTGCQTDRPPLPKLPPHRIIAAHKYENLKKIYPLMQPMTCHSSYPDWFVCIPENFWGGCQKLPYRRFNATSDDAMKLDGDQDGIACER